MMKVYVITESHDLQAGSENLVVFSTRDLAQKWIDKRPEQNVFAYEIEEWEVITDEAGLTIKTGRRA